VLTLNLFWVIPHTLLPKIVFNIILSQLVSFLEVFRLKFCIIYYAPIHARCPAQLSLLDLIALVLSREEFKLRSFSSYPFVTLFFFGPNISNTLFSNTMFSSLAWEKCNPSCINVSKTSFSNHKLRQIGTECLQFRTYEYKASAPSCL
jgi:hypothetical protein